MRETLAIKKIHSVPLPGAETVNPDMITDNPSLGSHQLEKKKNMTHYSNIYMYVCARVCV